RRPEHRDRRRVLDPQVDGVEDGPQVDGEGLARLAGEDADARRGVRANALLPQAGIRRHGARPDVRGHGRLELAVEEHRALAALRSLRALRAVAQLGPRLALD